jgi:protease-4
MSEARGGLLARTVGALLRLLDAIRLFVVNVIFVGVLAIVFASVIAALASPSVEDGVGLALELRGRIVEAPTPVTTLQAALGAPMLAETVLDDVLDAIRQAQDDARIGAIVLVLRDLAEVDLAKATTIGDALDAFRAGGRPVFVFGEFLGQHQYLLASHADRVYLHPMGEVMLAGYATHGLYLREALERLGVSVNVFRVGEFKSAVEPYLRDDMSEAARAASQHVLDAQWRILRDRLAGNRRLSAAAIDDYVTGIATHARATGGDLARAALEHGLVDELLGMEAFMQRLGERVGRDDAGRPRLLPMDDYLRAVRREPPPADAEIAVVTARGAIVLDDPGGANIGARQLVGELRALREQERVKAIVLRIDSPGGSAYASELIREALQQAQQAGKRVVASMSGVAASGGYWIAASADEIWADPATITGSIGIFAVVPTFERSLSMLGVHTDGVATSPLAGGIDPLRPLGEPLQQLLAASIEFGYRRFIDTVAAGRGLEPAAVEAVAGGRIWTGVDALEHGLVDGLGGLDDAIGAAARVAGLEHYAVRERRRQPGMAERVLGSLVGATTAGTTAGVDQVLSQLRSAVADLVTFDDPRGIYARCMACGR